MTERYHLRKMHNGLETPSDRSLLSHSLEPDWITAATFSGPGELLLAELQSKGNSVEMELFPEPVFQVGNIGSVNQCRRVGKDDK